MDVSEEMKKFYELGNEQLQEELQFKIEELQKKSYLFKVLDIVNKIDEKIRDNTFENANMYYVELKKYHDYDLGYVFDIELLDEKKRVVHKYGSDGNHIHEYGIVSDLISSYQFTLEYIIENDRDENEFVLKLDETFKDNFKNICLNNELLTLSNYMNLEREIANNGEKKKNRMKV